ncbi:DUF4102 domain-containing protein [Thiocystis violascens]|nr:DUF4102 domain-containing protein [Thiocystis violascens]
MAWNAQSYRSQGRKRLMTLGAYGVLTLDLDTAADARQSFGKNIATFLRGKLARDITVQDIESVLSKVQERGALAVESKLFRLLLTGQRPSKKSWVRDGRLGAVLQQSALSWQLIVKLCGSIDRFLKRLRHGVSRPF